MVFDPEVSPSCVFIVFLSPGSSLIGWGPRHVTSLCSVIGRLWDLRREMQFPGVELEHCPADATQRESNPALSLVRTCTTWPDTGLWLEERPRQDLPEIWPETKGQQQPSREIMIPSGWWLEKDSFSSSVSVSQLLPYHFKTWIVW